MNLDESEGICERKTLFRMKKETDQAGFKGTRTGPEEQRLSYTHRVKPLLRLSVTTNKLEKVLLLN